MQSVHNIEASATLTPQRKKLKRDRDNFESSDGSNFTQLVRRLYIESEDEKDDKDQAAQGKSSTSTTLSDPREFSKKWHKTFAWLQFNDNLMTCKWCKKYHAKGKFVTGSDRYKVDGLRNHASSKKHLLSIKLIRESAHAQNLFQQQFIIAQKEFERYFRLVNFITKENLAMLKYPQLIKLSEEMGVKFPSNCYQSIYAFKEMLFILSEVCFKKLIELVKQSPWFSILLDESTDIAAHKSVIIYIRFYNRKTFRVETNFLKVFDIEQADANYIYNVTTTFLKHLGLLTEYRCC